MTSTDHLGIVELRTLCAELSSRHRALFETLGGWVVTTEEPVLQQLFAEACHRHAWHARLWDERSPTIPGGDDEQVVPSVIPADTRPAERVARYREALAGLIERTTEVGARADPLLDPGTGRVTELTLTDLRDLARRAHEIA